MMGNRGADGNAWQTALTAESAYQILDTNGQPLRQVQVGLSPFVAGTDTLIDFSNGSGLRRGSVLPGPIRWSLILAPACRSTASAFIPG